MKIIPYTKTAIATREKRYVSPEIIKNPLPYLGGYVKLITAFHAEFEKQIRGERSEFYRKYLGWRDYLLSAMGQKSYTPHELIHMEIAGTRDLIDAIKPVKRHAKQALAQIVDYIHGQDRLFHESTINNNTTSGQMSYLSNAVRNKQSLIDQLDASDENWLIAKTARRALQHEHFDSKSIVNIARDRKYFYEVNEQPVDNAEYLMRNTLLLTERIEDAAKGYLDRLENLLPTFLNISEQGKHASEMQKALDMLSHDEERLVQSTIQGSEKVGKGFHKTKAANEKTADSMSIFQNVLRRYYDES